MSNEYYPLHSEVSITESCKFISHCLLNFIVWLVNDSCFYQENNYEGISNDILRKCISIAECEIFLGGYFQNQEAVMKFSKDNVSDCEEIFITQEEADTRIILQSMFVYQQIVKRNSNGRIVIKSSDNDVLLLSLHFYSKMTNIDELWFQTGSITSVKDGRQFIPVHNIYNSLGAEMAIFYQ